MAISCLLVFGGLTPDIKVAGCVAGGTGFRVEWRAIMVISKDGRFEWDEEKDEINKKKHGFGFAEILPVFDDPFFLEGYDFEHSDKEERYFGIGCINEVLVVLVFYTERNGQIRLYSARLADKRDREVYFGNCRNNDAATNSRNS